MVGIFKAFLTDSESQIDIAGYTLLVGPLIYLKLRHILLNKEWIIRQIVAAWILETEWLTKLWHTSVLVKLASNQELKETENSSTVFLDCKAKSNQSGIDYIIILELFLIAIVLEATNYISC